ncbi:putative L-ascorbate peroxidase 6, chloroplastic [Hordeum vulgare]|nr:putative L-ascorbate peroxidase 6, chloroplastic [Hordeum vulgare]
METLMVDRIHSSLRLFMNRDAVFLCERVCPPPPPPRSTPSRPPRPPSLTPPFSARSEPTLLSRRNSRQDETDLMGLLQSVMGDMVTELDEAEVRDAENATKQREACNVADDEGPPAPKLPSGKVRLGWHDAGTYDKNISEWAKCGGANGSLRFEIELKHVDNAGLVNALKLIQAIKDKYTGVTYADLFQHARAGGPKIPMIYGRVDVSAPEQCPPEGRLPGTQYAAINLLIRLQFHGDDQILRFYAASQRLVLEVS